MSKLLATVAVAALLAGGCANKTTSAGAAPAPAPAAGGAGSGQPGGGRASGGGTTATTGGATAGSTAAGTGRAGGAGTQAAARVTPEQLDAAMKSIAQTNQSLQANLKSSTLPAAAKDAQQLAQLFGDVERFFAQNNKPDAVMLAQTARNGATDAAAAATAGDAMKAMAGASAMGTTCKQCHSVYREGDAQTGYRVKAGTITP